VGALAACAKARDGGPLSADDGSALAQLVTGRDDDDTRVAEIRRVLFGWLRRTLEPAGDVTHEPQF